MAKIARNAPCPCGSGRKHKHCCLGPMPEVVLHVARDGTLELGKDIDGVSNGVLALIAENQLDEAEAACHVLLREFPDATDGHERLGRVYEARGDARNAAQHYRAAAAIIDAAPPGDYDPEVRENLLAKAQRLDPGR